MKTAAIRLSVAFGIANTGVFAQSMSDPLAQLRACSVMEHAERLACLDKLSRDIEPSPQPAPQGGNWIVSETTSPVDYKQIVAATTHSRGGSDRSFMRLSVHCRGGRTELVIAGPAVSRGEDYIITYRINSDQPVQLAARSPSYGTGAAFGGDVVRLLQSLPEQGDIAVRLSTSRGVAQEGSFSLSGLTTVRAKIAAACEWPRPLAAPRE